MSGSRVNKSQPSLAAVAGGEGGPLLGAHTSVAGGLYRAVERGSALGCRAIQIFTRNQNRWESPEILQEEIERFRRALEASAIVKVVAHGSYLVNRGSPDPNLRERSLKALADELERASTLGIPYVIFHPGAATESSEREGLRRVVQSLDRLIAETRHLPARLAIETTAGQGSSLGCRFEHLAFFWQEMRAPGKLFLCVDTCHVFAAGYELRTADGYGETFRKLEKAVPLSRIIAFHVNDSKRERGSRVDRHEHIGKGCLGPAAFRLLLRDPRWIGVPMLIETPKGSNLEWDRRNLRLLRKLAGGAKF